MCGARCARACGRHPPLGACVQQGAWRGGGEWRDPVLSSASAGLWRLVSGQLWQRPQTCPRCAALVVMGRPAHAATCKAVGVAASSATPIKCCCGRPFQACCRQASKPIERHGCAVILACGVRRALVRGTAFGSLLFEYATVYCSCFCGSPPPRGPAPAAAEHDRLSVWPVARTVCTCKLPQRAPQVSQIQLGCNAGMPAKSTAFSHAATATAVWPHPKPLQQAEAAKKGCPCTHTLTRLPETESTVYP